MIFECRHCGKPTMDIDRVLDGSCECGCSSFRLVSNDASTLDSEFSVKERVRRELYSWIDINLDALNPDDLENLSVTFMHFDDKESE